MRNGNIPVDAERQGASGHDDRPSTPPGPIAPGERDEREKRKHDASENELASTQEKNPIPPGTTRRTS